MLSLLVSSVQQGRCTLGRRGLCRVGDHSPHQGRGMGVGSLTAGTQLPSPLAGTELVSDHQGLCVDWGRLQESSSVPGAGDVPGGAEEGAGGPVWGGLSGVCKDFPVSSPRYELRYGEVREQEQEFEAEEGLMPAEDFVPAENFVPAEDLVPEEELGATEEVVPAEEEVTEEAELVSEEAEAWEEVEPELDETRRTNVVTSALEASGLGPAHLDMKYVLQQLASWQDAHYRRQLRQKMLQKGECSRGGLPPASQTSCRSSSR